MENNVKEYSKTGIYKQNGEEHLFSFNTSLNAEDKLRFVAHAVKLLVGENFNYVIKDLIFDFVIIVVFTDFDTSKIDNDDMINQIEKLLEETNIVEIVKSNVDKDVFEELQKAIDYNIEYKTGIHVNSISNSVTKLLNTIEKKVSEINIDTESLTEMANLFGSISGNFTPETVLDAYSKSDMFKDGYEKYLEKRDKHKEKIDEIVSNSNETILN